MAFVSHLSYFLLPFSFFPSPSPFPYSYTSSPYPSPLAAICTQSLVYVQMSAPHVPLLSLFFVRVVCLAVCFAVSYLQVLVIYCEHTVPCVVYEMDIVVEIG